MNENQDRQRVIDEEHLRLLSIFHYISGVLTLFVSLIFLFQFFLFSVIFDEIMQSLMDASLTGLNEFDPAILSVLFYLWIVLFFLFVVFGIAQILSGKYLKAKKHRIFSFIVAIVNILSFPYGTILGVMTVVVLSRSSVIELYR